MPFKDNIMMHESDKELPFEWVADGNFADHAMRMIYKIAYGGHLVMSFFLRPTVYGAYVAVWQDQKILLIRNSYKALVTLPCGGIDKGETSLMAAKRELMEEVGLDLPYDSFKKVRETVSWSEFKKDYIVIYEVHLTSLMAVKLDGREVIWAGLKERQEALAMPLVPVVREYLQV